MRAANLMHSFAAAASEAIVMFCVPLAAQDLEPRAYSNSPIGLHFVLVGYAYTTGKLLTDPSLPIDNAVGHQQEDVSSVDEIVWIK
jgi:hypothetical protein